VRLGNSEMLKVVVSSNRLFEEIKKAKVWMVENVENNIHVLLDYLFFLLFIYILFIGLFRWLVLSFYSFHLPSEILNIDFVFLQ
jgi:hypothetical protein